MTGLPLGAEIGGPPVLWEPIADRDVASLAAVDIVWAGDYEAVVIDFANIKPATDNVEPWVRLSGDGGASFDTGAADYYSRGHYWHGSQSTRGNGLSVIPLSLTGGTVMQGNGANEWLHGRIVIAKPFDAASKTQLIGEGGYVDSIGNVFSWQLFGQRDTAKRTDGVRFLYSSGNVAEGRLAVYGLRLP